MVPLYQLLSLSLFQYQKYNKRQQRLERQQAKEAERKAEIKAVSYTIRVQDMLNLMGDDDRENFRTGSDGAVVSLLGRSGGGEEAKEGRRERGGGGGGFTLWRK